DNNIVRVTIQTLAAALGGTQILHTNSRDEALALPSEDSVMIALRTQQIVAEESGITNTIDPLAGSYYVEAMTDLIEKEAADYIDKIDSLGGMAEAIESGFVQTEIQKSAYKYEMEIEENERIIVGVNKYQVEETEHKDLLKIDIKVQEEQIKFLKKIRSQRNNAEVNKKLTALKNAAEGTENLMPFILDAVRAYASIGEICNSMRSVFGEYKENVVM
ncbi:MAG TPA: methylmalonyl-CoA mutase family protein, partial [Ignavibacteriaceae bacterium]